MRAILAAGLLIAAPALAFAQTATPPGNAPATTPMTPGTAMAPRTTTTGAAPAATTVTTAPVKLSAADQKFVEKIASADMAEVQEAQLAQQKSQDGTVKDFAQQMVTDHQANTQQLTTLAQQKGITLPTTIDSADQKDLDKLQNLSGKKFDRAYMKGQVRDHEKVLKLVQKEAQSGGDPDLRNFAQQTVPVIQKHLDMAKGGKGA